MSEAVSDEHQAATTIRGIHHVAISVADLEAAVAFYTGTMGLERVDGGAFCTPADGESAVASAVLAGPNAYLELNRFADAPPAPADGVPVEGPGFTHICFQCPAPEGLYYRAREQGARVVSLGDDPVDLGGYGVRYAYLRDADATMFEIEQIDAPKFDTPVWLAHVALVTADIDRLVDFYRAVLGIEPKRRVNKVTGPRVDEVTGLPDARARAAWFWFDNMLLELWEYLSPPTPVAETPPAPRTIGYTGYLLEVADVGAERERLRTLGVELVGDLTSVPSGRCQYVRDPDGNLFGLLELSQDEPRTLAARARITWDD